MKVFLLLPFVTSSTSYVFMYLIGSIDCTFKISLIEEISVSFVALFACSISPF